MGSYVYEFVPLTDCAYDKCYLEPAQTNLGRMLEIAVDSFQFGLTEFYILFLMSDIAQKLALGDYRYTTGCSGAELAKLVLEQTGSSSMVAKANNAKIRYRYDRSPEYWCGWALAKYQWKNNLSFSAIDKFAPIKEVRRMYKAYHEMDWGHFNDRMNELRFYKKQTVLAEKRISAGFSQSKLAKITGVPVRSIQQYEQQQKDLRKASAATVSALSRALFCTVEDLLV